MKKTVIFLLVVSMALHCASRIGFLSYIYANRHLIAYHAGLVAEPPIAMCNSDYDFGKGLSIQEGHEAHSTLPPQFVAAHEINLIVPQGEIALNPARVLIGADHRTPVITSHYAPPSLSIFHPPS